jgi:hypothetical protein
MNVLLEYVTVTALILGAVFLTAIVLAVAGYIVLAVAGLVMLVRQARGEFDNEEEDND